MSLLFDAMRGDTYSTTFNGAKTLANSGNDLVDLFGAIGSSRGKDVTDLFGKTLCDEMSSVIAARILLWSRDVRGGAGERQTFRNLLKVIERKDEVLTLLVMRKIPEVGRWDDLLVLSKDYAINYAYNMIANALAQGNGLCAKWMPRKGLHAVMLRNHMGLSPKAYRKLLVSLTNVVESKMCAKDWSAINYEHVPSVASSRYAKAFGRNDTDRYVDYLGKLEKGEAKVNASAIFPYDVIRGLRTNETLANAQWKALPNYLEGSTENLLCVVDTSSSMECAVGGSGSLQCLDVAVSLGMYVSERSKGIFQDQFITFNSTPQLIQIGGSLAHRYLTTKRAPWGGSTNIQKTFDLILESARRAKLSQEDMPTKLLIFSDMEFNQVEGYGRNQTNFQAIERKYNDFGYKRPTIVFWNLNARSGNSPVKFDENGTALVSGFSPSLMKSILASKNTSSFSMMMETIMSSRYDLS